MGKMDSPDLRYPIGKFRFPDVVSPDDRNRFLGEIREAPARLRAAIAGLNDVQLDTPYRPGGWTVRQVVHHVPDSHSNAYTRFKLALTEDVPTIKPYDEAAWATLEDTRITPIETSLAMMDALHDRWVRLLQSLGPADFARTLNHPENGIMNLDQLLALYAWHGAHHVAHITNLRRHNNWT